MDKTITYIVAILAVVSLVIATYGFVAFQGQIDDLKVSISDMEGKLAIIDTIEGPVSYTHLTLPTKRIV